MNPIVIFACLCMIALPLSTLDFSQDTRGQSTKIRHWKLPPSRSLEFKVAKESLEKSMQISQKSADKIGARLDRVLKRVVVDKKRYMEIDKTGFLYGQYWDQIRSHWTTQAWLYEIKYEQDHLTLTVDWLSLGSLPPGPFNYEQLPALTALNDEVLAARLKALAKQFFAFESKMREIR